MGYSLWGLKESDMTERLPLFFLVLSAHTGALQGFGN